MRKKASNSDSFVAPNVKLTREDLDEILEIFTHNLQNVSIEDDKMIYDSLDEVEQHRGKMVGYLIISGSSPYSVVVMNHPKNKRVRVETASVEPWSHGYHTIKSLLGERARFAYAKTVEFLTVVFVLLFTLIVVSTTQQKIPLFIGLLLCFVLMMSALLLGSKAYYGHFNHITLQKRHELEGFWTRNKDKVWLIVLAALVGFLFSYTPALINWLKSLR